MKPNVSQSDSPVVATLDYAVPPPPDVVRNERRLRGLRIFVRAVVTVFGSVCAFLLTCIVGYALSHFTYLTNPFPLIVAMLSLATLIYLVVSARIDLATLIFRGGRVEEE